MPRLPAPEVESYLRRAGLTERQIEEVVGLYEVALTTSGEGSAASWSRSETLAWLDNQIEDRGRRAPEPSTTPQTTVAQRPRATTAPEPEEAEPATGGLGGLGAVGQWAGSVLSSQPIDDRGPMDGAAISQALAEGENPMVVWDEIRGRTFNLGALGFPGLAERQQKGYRPPNRAFTGTEPGTPGRVSPGGSSGPGPLGQIEGAAGKLAAKLSTRAARGRRQYLSPTEALALLGSMPEDYLTRLQTQMYEAGLYQAAADQLGSSPIPSWGIADPATRRAYMALFIEASLTPDQPIDRVLNRLIDERGLRRGVEGGGAGGGGMQIEPFAPTNIISETEAGKLVNDMAQDLLGRFANDDERAAITKRLQDHQIALQRQQYEGQVQAAGGKGASEIDAFMEAIASTESGGDSSPYDARNPSGAYGRWQIMPANWPSWSQEAGLGRNAPQTPENQRAVVRFKMLQYYEDFGNWRDVAVAWFAGPGAVGKADADRRSDGNITVAEYAARAVDGMARYRGGAAPSGELAPVYSFDPAAETEAQLKRMDPSGYAGSQWADRAIEFFSLLQGVA